VAFTASFTQFDVRMFNIADLTNGSATLLQDQPDLAGGKPHVGVFALFGQQLS
jgi:hypothetical protein